MAMLGRFAPYSIVERRIKEMKEYRLKANITWYAEDDKDAVKRLGECLRQILSPKPIYNIFVSGELHLSEVERQFLNLSGGSPSASR